MKWAVLALLAGGCAVKPIAVALDHKIAAILPPRCATNAEMPNPPPLGRSIQSLASYAQEAGRSGNFAVKERDDCAKLYLTLRATMERK